MKISFLVPIEWKDGIERAMKRKGCVTASELLRELLREAIEKYGERE